MGEMLLIEGDDDARASVLENWIVLQWVRHATEKTLPAEAGHLGMHHRGNTYLFSNRFREALAEYEGAVRHLPTSFAHNEAAIRMGCLLAHFDRVEDYKKHCRKIAKQYADEKNIFIMERTIRMCLFTDIAQPKEVLEIMARYDERISANLDREAEQKKFIRIFRNYFHLAQGIAAYRRGDIPTAKVWFEKSNALSSEKSNGHKLVRSMNLFFMAMIAQRDDRNADAKLRLAQANAEMESIHRGGGAGLFIDWLMLRKVQAEARALIDHGIRP